MNNCWFMDWAEINDIIYFYSPQLHSIMKADIKEEKIEIERQLLDAEYDFPGKFITMKHFANKLFFLPLYGQSVCIYNLEQKSVENMQLEANTKLGYSIFSSVRVKDKIIGIPGRYSRFIVIDCVDHTKKEIEFDIKKMNEDKVSRSVYFTRSNHVYDNILFVGSLMENYIVSISLETYKVEYYKLECCNEENRGVYTLCGNGQELYVLGNDGKLRIYEFLHGNLIFKKMINMSSLTLNNGVYSSSLYLKGKFIIFTFDGIFICDLSSEEVNKCFFEVKNIVDSVVNSIGFLYACSSNDIIRAMSAMDFVEYFFNEDMDIIGRKKYFVEDNELCKLEPYLFVNEQKEVYPKNLNFWINNLI